MAGIDLFPILMLAVLFEMIARAYSSMYSQKTGLSPRGRSDHPGVAQRRQRWQQGL